MIENAMPAPPTEDDRTESSAKAVARVGRAIKREVIHEIQQSWAGPLPPPAALVAYNDAFDGCAERIVKMAETQSMHRQELEARALSAKAIEARIGQVFALTVALFAIGSGTFLAWSGKETSGVASIIAALVGLVVVFYVATSTQADELRRKMEDLRRRVDGDQRDGKSGHD